jgi:hypothetical protein
MGWYGKDCFWHKTFHSVCIQLDYLNEKSADGPFNKINLKIMANGRIEIDQVLEGKRTMQIIGNLQNMHFAKIQLTMAFQFATLFLRPNCRLTVFN